MANIKPKVVTKPGGRSGSTNTPVKRVTKPGGLKYKGTNSPAKVSPKK